MVVSTVASQREGSRFDPHLEPPASSHRPKTGMLGSLVTLKIILRSERAWLFVCGPVMDWRPVQGVSCLSPDDHGSPRDPTVGLSGYRKRMDG